MTQAIGPMSLSVWDEPCLLVAGFDHPPTVMMGHHKPQYQAWVEGAGYTGVKDLYTYEIDITGGRRCRRSSSASSSRASATRESPCAASTSSRFDAEATLILNILNDAWSDNWGYVPLTDAEIAYAGRKLKPIVFED